MSISTIDLLTMTYNSLRGNPLRSLLTALGMFMGVASVSATVQVSNISRAVIEKQLAEREAPQLSVYYWTSNDKQLDIEDLEFLKRRLKGWQAISSYTGFTHGLVIFQDQQTNLAVHAVSQDYVKTSGRKIQQGRFFSQTDFDHYKSVAVIDRFLVDKLFIEKDPIGQRLYADNQPYIVVGVMETKRKDIEYEPKGEMLVPLSLYRSVIGSREIGAVQIRPYTLEGIEQLEQQAQKLLSQRYPRGKFWATKNVDDILEQQRTLKFVSNGLLILGMITLLLGGVGIANITFASVVERTSEIGLRLALGATPHNIKIQFIAEAIILYVVGGISAIALVHFGTVIVSNTFDLPYEFDLDSAALTLSSALVVGLASVYVPATQASRLDPVIALRASK